MKESELWRKLEKAWREADPNRPRDRWVSPEEEVTRFGLCRSVYLAAYGSGFTYYVMVDRVCSISRNGHSLTDDVGLGYYWPLTAEYDNVRADWCATFAEQCEKEEAE